MKKRQLLAFVVMGGISGLVAAGEWQFEPGLSYVSGVSDLADIYEANEEADGYTDVEITSVPVGLGFFSHYQFDSGVRLGYGLGPLFMIGGDLSHTELPLYATTGYTFFPASSVSPYVFGGFALHYVDGDYVVDDHQFTGAIYGVGIEFARNRTVSYVIEVARDTTEVDVETYTYTYRNGRYYDDGGIEKVKTYDTLVTFRLMF
jgi:hypothetical protein